MFMKLTTTLLMASLAVNGQETHTKNEPAAPGAGGSIRGKEQQHREVFWKNFGGKDSSSDDSDSDDNDGVGFPAFGGGGDNGGDKFGDLLDKFLPGGGGDDEQDEEEDQEGGNGGGKFQDIIDGISDHFNGIGEGNPLDNLNEIIEEFLDEIEGIDSLPDLSGIGLEQIGENLEQLVESFFGGGAMGIIDDIKNEFLTELSCEEEVEEPTCTRPFMNGKTGTWVCRTLHSPITGEPLASHSLCIDPELALKTADQCGCCEPDGCPEPCQCECNDGKGVKVEGPSKIELGLGVNVQLCLPPENALVLVAAVDQVQCDTSCIVN